MATLDAYTRYKQLEKHYRIKLLGNSRAEAEITSQTIRVGTQKAVQRSSDKFDERDFANLQQVIDLRRSATLYYESRGINCVGHQFWLDLLLWSQDKLTADWKIRMQSSNSSPTDIENVEEEFETLNIQQPEDIPSYQQTVEEVWLLSGLNSIQEMGEWLKELWRAANVGETDFATLGHGGLRHQNPRLLIKTDLRNSLQLCEGFDTSRVQLPIISTEHVRAERIEDTSPNYQD